MERSNLRIMEKPLKLFDVLHVFVVYMAFEKDFKALCTGGMEVPLCDTWLKQYAYDEGLDSMPVDW
jgi:hypothetical protein